MTYGIAPRTSSLAQSEGIPALVASGSRVGSLVSALGSFIFRGHDLYCLDGGNSFDPYRLALRASRQAGLNPMRVLDRVFISRAYTCHQLLEAVTTLLPPLLEMTPHPIVAILGVDRMFHDEDLAIDERRWLFDQMLTRAHGLLGSGLPLLVTFTNWEPNPWVPRAGGTVRLLAGPRELLPVLGKGAEGRLEACTTRLEPPVCAKGTSNGTHTSHLQHIHRSGNGRVAPVPARLAPRGSGGL